MPSFSASLRSLVAGLAWSVAGAAQAFSPPTYLTRFGTSQPNGPAVFTLNSGIGVNHTSGDVYVSDAISVQQFDRNGNWIRTWSCANCRGVDVDEVTGEVYVASLTDRIFRYSATGTLLQTIGSTGTGPGQFRYPHDVTVDSATGNIYVIDGLNARVQQLSATGTFIRAWGSQGLGDGQFYGVSAPYGITFDPLGRFVYVSDPQTRRVQKFDEVGNFVLKWETTEHPCGCQSPDQPRWIRNLSVASNGDVFLSDADGERISRWTPTGQYISTFRGPAAPGIGPFHPRAIVQNRNTGEIYVNAAYAERVDKFDAAGTYLFSWGNRLRDGDVLWQPSGIAVSPVTGDVYVLSSNLFRVKRFSATGAFLGEWGEAQHLVLDGVPPDHLVGFGRNALRADPDGDVWLVQGYLNYKDDPQNYSVQRFQGDGSFVSGWLGPNAAAEIQLSGAAIDPVTRRVAASEWLRNRVNIYESNGTLVRTIPVTNGPAGLAIWNGWLFVLQSGTNQILKFDFASGTTPVATWGSTGTGDGQLRTNAISGLFADPLGRIWVPDFSNNRIVVFGDDGTFLGSFGTSGSGPGQFRGPMDVAVTADAKVYVAEYSSNRVQALQSSFVTACNDGIDNDLDGAIDLADVTCAGKAWQDFEFVAGCGLGGELVFVLPLLTLWRRRAWRRGR